VFFVWLVKCDLCVYLCNQVRSALCSWHCGNRVGVCFRGFNDVTILRFFFPLGQTLGISIIFYSVTE